MKFNNSPERALILEASILRSEYSDGASIQQLSEMITDWEYLMKIGQQTGLCGLLYTRLAKVELSNKSFISIRNTLEKYYRLYQFNNMQILMGFESISSELINSNIAHIPLKGVDLISRLYDDPGLRPTSDIDLLIHIRHISKFTKTIESIGFSRLYKKRWRDWAFQSHQIDMLKSKGINVDLHQRLNKFRFFPKISTRTCWKYAIQEKESSSLYRLSNEHLLIHLVVHLYRHIYELIGFYKTDRNRDKSEYQKMMKFLWYGDIASLIFKHHKDINWKFFMQQSYQFGTSQATNSILATLLYYYPDLDSYIEQSVLQNIRKYSETNPHFISSSKKIFEFTLVWDKNLLSEAEYFNEHTTFDQKNFLSKIYSSARSLYGKVRLA